MVLPIEARDSLTLKFSILLNAQQECTEHAIRSFLCSHLKPDFQTLGMYTYCTVIIKLHFTEKEKKLICLHFEVSIFSSIAPDCQNSMICTPLTLLSNNEFFPYMQTIKTYTFSDYFTYSIAILVSSIIFLVFPKDSILGLPVQADGKENEEMDQTDQ